jgi:hypothetical protein
MPPTAAAIIYSNQHPQVTMLAIVPKRFSPHLVDDAGGRANLNTLRIIKQTVVQLDNRRRRDHTAGRISPQKGRCGCAPVGHLIRAPLRGLARLAKGLTGVWQRSTNGSGTTSQ